jgi:hypothetical protein
MIQNEIEQFFRTKLPKAWFTEPARVQVDGDEVLCVGRLTTGEDVNTFREATRAKRVSIAKEAEGRFGRKVSWAVELDGMTTFFSTLSTPVMTRLRLSERAVLDTLMEAGVARSRSDALAWCVRLVGRHQAEWLTDLRDALVGVERVRSEGPTQL